MPNVPKVQKPVEPLAGGIFADGVQVADLLTLFKGPITPAQIVSIVLAIVGLATTQSLISDGQAQLITGIASIVIPAAVALAQAIVSHGHSTVHAAQIAAGVKAADTSKPGS